MAKEHEHFMWNGFLEKDLKKLNSEKDNSIYGSILVEYDNQKYIIDVEWETKEDYDRNGISLNLYESNDEWQHCSLIVDLKTITRATNYQKFKCRVEKEIHEILENQETAFPRYTSPFPERLKNIRKERGKTQKELAKYLGISERGYQNYELGQREPSLKVLIQLSDYFEVTTDYLLGRE